MKVAVYRGPSGALSFSPVGERVAVLDVPDGSEVVPASAWIRESMLAVPVDPMLTHSWLARQVLLAAVEGDSRFGIVDVSYVPSASPDVGRN